MNILPQPFWVVTKPTPRSVMEDICNESSFGRLYLQFLGGLRYSQIHGIYTSHAEAEREAQKLLTEIAQNAAPLPTARRS